MLKVQKSQGYLKVFNTQTNQFVTMQYNGKLEDIKDSSVIAHLGEVIKVRASFFKPQLQEDIKIITINNEQKVIAVIKADNLDKPINQMNINEIMQNPTAYVCLFNVNGEFITEVQNYESQIKSPIAHIDVKSVSFKLAFGVDEVAVKQIVCVTLPNGQETTQERILEFPYNIEEKTLELSR